MLGVPELELGASDSHSNTEFNANSAKDKGVTSLDRIQCLLVQKYQHMIIVTRMPLFRPVN
jgi:hypothetical protein